MKLFMAAGAPKKRRISLISAPVTGTAKHIIHDTGTEVGFTATGTPDNYRMATLRLTLQAEWVSGLVQRDKRSAVIQNVLRQLRGRQRSQRMALWFTHTIS
ncbi:hypothetical protein NIHE100087_pN1430 (plasmid) [Enterobacter hormaechei]|uniref:hypothetical protein n=1 Tax=Enterobacteriaceae TaxID=543 RepID=UPI000AC0A261|nr:MULTISPECIES: hypothetical protein [Enterobacteriaceae]WBM81999.1 hypothetical protein NB968_00510 [Escherichia coli]WBM82539.1 hypothetical protein NB979_00370 [Escherichia coli]WBM84540.1 hypothetical protein NB976_00385 [Klebsiella pneumoniae]BDA99630.1 hypothetical protein NIHE100087_pN1430 [Enterobacter hormaechei]